MENTITDNNSAPTEGKWHVSIWAGVFFGGLFTLPLVTILFLADGILGLPFVPFDVFSFIRDLLPGAVLTFGIDSMVSVISIFGLPVDTTAKFAEQLMAVGMVVVIGAIIGGIAYFVINRTKRDAITIGAVFGVLFGVAMALIVAGKNITATADPIISLAWVLILHTLWGTSLGWVYSQWQTLGARPLVTSEQAPQISQLDRRKFLIQIGGATATLTAVGAGLGFALRSQPEVDTSTAFTIPSTVEPEATPAVTDAPITTGQLIDDILLPTGTRPEITPLDDHYRIDISARPPVIDADTYRLKISGMVDEPLEIRLTDLVEGFTPVNQYITLSCISNQIGGHLISTTLWTGIPFRVLMESWKVSRAANYAKITAADGFDEWIPLGVARMDERVMLAYAWDGQPLKQKHGFPLRIYIPDRYGMKQPKWITNIEFVTDWDEGYWVRRGWSEQALVQTTSVVDTVAIEDIYERDGITYVPIGGIAYSGAKGISAVEVQVGEDSDWIPAQLKAPLSDTTWVMWRAEWAFSPGEHFVRVRTREGRGKPQEERNTPVRPDGATGLHLRRVTLETPTEG